MMDDSELTETDDDESRGADVCIVMGSRSDLPVSYKATTVLDALGVRYAMHVASAVISDRSRVGARDGAMWHRSCSHTAT